MDSLIQYILIRSRRTLTRMGIDVFTAPLAVHFLGAWLDPRTLGRDFGERRTAGEQVSSKGRPLGPLRAYFGARRVLRHLDVEGLRPGNPYADPMGFIMDVDQMDTRAWSALAQALTANCGADDPYPDSMHDRSLDAFPGIAFARALDSGNLVCVPGMRGDTVVTSGISFIPLDSVREFVDAAAESLGYTAIELDEGYAPDRTEDDNLRLYNLSLFHQHANYAREARQPLGVWG